MSSLTGAKGDIGPGPVISIEATSVSVTSSAARETAFLVHDGSSGRARGVVGCTQAAVEVVVDDANVLHERVHGGRSHEAVPLRLQLPGGLLRLRD
jgi:hypothetical protein